MKKAIVVIVICLVFIGGFFILQQLSIKQTKRTVGTYQVTEQTRQENGNTICRYVADYKGKKITLGEYPSVSGCHTTQSVVSNGMLAIAAGQYTFFYDPVTDSVHKLDPLIISTFTDFAKTQDIDFNSYPTRRYFLNANTWQIVYQTVEGTGNKAEYLVFVTKDAGNTFSFHSMTHL